jgi:prephenate dehydrogenase
MALFERVVIVGVGLLGGSIGLALRERQLAHSIVGYGRNPERLRQAFDCGAVTEVSSEFRQACQGADAIIVCTPVQQVAGLVLEGLTAARSDVLITDVGSTKLGICQAVAGHADQNFCGSHPLAGSDKSGVVHARADLLVERLTVVTPNSNTPASLVERTERLWRQLGSRTLRMTPQDHDRALASTSHLPHIVASALAAATPDELLPLVATGWCDTTRIAAGAAELWRQILEENRQPIIEALEDYSNSLTHWLTALRSGDGQQLEQLLQAGKQKRDSVGN